MNYLFIIDRLEGDQAVLSWEGETIVWPRKFLPADAKAGAALYFAINDSPEKQAEGRALARDILNEILDTPDN